MQKDTQHTTVEDLVIRFILNECTERESVFVQDLLINDAEAIAHYKAYSQLYAHASSLDLEDRFDVDSAFATFQAQSTHSPKNTGKSVRLAIYISSIAASILFAIGFFIQQNHSQIQFVPLVSNNDTAQNVLADGSVISLNKNTTLNYSFDDPDKRLVQMEYGEAFFKVAKDSSRPFIVLVQGLEVTVLGTAFNIKSSIDDRVYVTVTEGSVSVRSMSTPSQHNVLKYGDLATYCVSSDSLSHHQTETHNELFWKTGILEFVNAPYSEFVPILENEYGVTIQYDSVLVKDCFLTAKFTNQPIDAVLEIISFTLAVSVEKDSARFILNQDEACY